MTKESKLGQDDPPALARSGGRRLGGAAAHERMKTGKMPQMPSGADPRSKVCALDAGNDADSVPGRIIRAVDLSHA